jgi:hypothetical protein
VLWDSVTAGDGIVVAKVFEGGVEAFDATGAGKWSLQKDYRPLSAAGSRVLFVTPSNQTNSCGD